MKKILVVLIALFALGLFNKSEARISGNGYAVDYFYRDLAPYGEWIEIDYDVFVWRPNSVHYSWQPYSVGRWVWTYDGWYWDSYEPFGWATYHYGRWFYDDYYGWVWLPDTQWGPSWVEWRYNSDYIGWAPLPPYAEFRLNIGIHFSISWRSSPIHWHFVRYNHFHHHNLHNYIAASKYNYRIFNKTKYRTNYYERNGRIVNGGISRDYVERRSGEKIRTYELHESRTNLRDNRSRDRNSTRINVYRPSDDDIRNSRKIDRSKISHGKERTTLRTDKLAISRNRNNDQAETRERIPTRENVRGNDQNIRGKVETEKKREAAHSYERTQSERKSEINSRREIDRYKRKSSPVKRSETKSRYEKKETQSRSESRTYESRSSKNENRSYKQSTPKRETSSNRSYGSSRSSGKRQDVKSNKSRNDNETRTRSRR